MGNTKIRERSLDKCFNVYGDLLSSNVPTNMGQLIQSLNILPPWAFECCLSPVIGNWILVWMGWENEIGGIQVFKIRHVNQVRPGIPK